MLIHSLHIQGGESDHVAAAFMAMFAWPAVPVAHAFSSNRIASSCMRQAHLLALTAEQQQDHDGGEAYEDEDEDDDDSSIGAATRRFRPFRPQVFREADLQLRADKGTELLKAWYELILRLVHTSSKHTDMTLSEPLVIVGDQIDALVDFSLKTVTEGLGNMLRSDSVEGVISFILELFCAEKSLHKRITTYSLLRPRQEGTIFPATTACWPPLPGQRESRFLLPLTTENHFSHPLLHVRVNLPGQTLASALRLAVSRVHGPVTDHGFILPGHPCETKAGRFLSGMGCALDADIAFDPALGKHVGSGLYVHEEVVDIQSVPFLWVLLERGPEVAEVAIDLTTPRLTVQGRAFDIKALVLRDGDCHEALVWVAPGAWLLSNVDEECSTLVTPPGEDGKFDGQSVLDTNTVAVFLVPHG